MAGSSGVTAFLRLATLSWPIPHKFSWQAAGVGTFWDQAQGVVVFEWPFRTKKKSFPSYSLLEARPSRCLPQDLADREASDDFQAWADKIQADLIAESHSEDLPHFAIFLKLGDGLLQLELPEGRCLLVFASMMHAADYISVQVPHQTDKLDFFSSTPRDAAQVIQHFRQHANIRLLALNRCPRCDIFTCLDAAAMDTSGKLIRAWKISLATLLARRDLYWDYARSAARNEMLLTARDVALELVGHVTPADPKTHYLLGKLAIRLHDRDLLREARAFLEFLGEPGAVQELQLLERTDEWQF
jgi:hypothetical protein